jgi:hypothetical protein
MKNPIGVRGKVTSVALVGSIALALVFVAGVTFGQSGYFYSLGIGEPPSTRGEQLRVRGWTIFGVAGQQGGAVTFMPPDGTGWYSIDNPGGQRFRITGGYPVGQFEYVTIRHPGHVTINGDLQVAGNLTDASGRPYASARSGFGLPRLAPAETGGGKADSLTDLQFQIDALRLRVNDLVETVNQMQ